MNEFHWDVFLSHSSADQPRVARLATRLEQKGFRVWFSDRKIEGGQDFVAAIEEGLQQSQVMILCMTKEAFESNWVTAERNAATLLDLDDRGGRLLPLLFEDCEIPAMLRRLQHIDWRDESEDAWRQLLAHLRPNAEPMPADPSGQLNPFDPFNPAIGSRFVGRAKELRRLQQAVEREHSVTVVGDWRIGKSSLLCQFAERARAGGRAVRLLSSEGRESESLAAFVHEITGLSVPDDPDIAANQLSQWAEANCRSGFRPVLIVDAVEPLIPKFDHQFFVRLRGMLELLTVVLCSRRELDRVYTELGRTSPFYNTLDLVRVALLDSAAVEEMLKWADGLLQPQDLSVIREWAGRHPYYVQLLGHELAEARLRESSIADANDHFYELSSQQLRDMWKVISERDREELRKVVANVPVTRKPLQLRGLITDDGRPFGRILREWLKELEEEQP